MPRNHCPPSRRGHTWHKPTFEELASMDDPATRVCERCGKLGRVNKQGVIYAVEAA